MDKPGLFITKSPEETTMVGKAIGSDYLKSLKKGSPINPSVFCLYGELGSGKTTFAQGFAKGLGIKARLLSPTFIIVRRYDLPLNTYYFYHLDFYRISNTNELKNLGLADIFTDPNSVILIEWADKFESLLPQKRTDVLFSILENQSHKIEIKLP